MSDVASQQNKGRPDFKIAAYTKQVPAMKICQDICAGTLTIRNAGKEYLPANPQEPPEEYQARLSRSVVLPAFKRAITLALGLVFDKDPTTKELNATIEEHLKNIDLTGKPVGLFARDTLKLALRDGHSFIYVDMPKKVEKSETLAPEPTLTDERNAGMRPYWQLYGKDQAVNWRIEIVNGKQVLQQITFRECAHEADGEYGEVEKIYYRVLNPGRFRVYSIDDKGNAVLHPDKSGTTSLNYIPVYPVYGGEELEMFVSDPPLLNLALLNIQHYQMSSDLQSILHVANVPILWARDRNQRAPFQAIGPSVLIDLTGEHSALGYAEHEGKAIGKAQEEIKQVEMRMSVAGFELLADKTKGPETATGEIKDAAESDSELSVAVKSLTAALMQALSAHCDYARIELGKGVIELNVEYERLVMSVQEMTEFRNLANDHHLSTRSLLELLKRAGKLGQDFDIEKELVNIFGEEDADQPDVVRGAGEDDTRDDDAEDDDAL